MKKLLFAAAVAMLGSVAANAATVVTTNGYVTGANGVSVNGTMYDVTFNNRCAEAYGTCSETGTFAFTDGDTAAAALEALRDQVFEPGDMRWVQGCEPDYGASHCYFILGYLDGDEMPGKLGHPNGIISDLSSSFFLYEENDSVYLSYISFAAVTGAVPEPATWAMMMLGFGGIGYAMRRRNEAGTRVRFA